MPTQNRIGLDNEQRLLPERSGASEQQEFDAIEVIELRTLALALKDDELLAQKGVFGDEIGFAASQVGCRSTCQRQGVGFEPAFDVILNDIDQSTAKFDEDLTHFSAAPVMEI